MVQKYSRTRACQPPTVLTSTYTRQYSKYYQPLQRKSVTNIFSHLAFLTELTAKSQILRCNIRIPWYIFKFEGPNYRHSSKSKWTVYVWSHGPWLGNFGPIIRSKSNGNYPFLGFKTKTYCTITFWKLDDMKAWRHNPLLLSANCWPHFYLSSDRGERVSSQFMSNLWSVGYPSCCWLYRQGLPLESIATQVLQDAGSVPIHTLAGNTSLIGIEPAPHPVMSSMQYSLNRLTTEAGLMGYISL